MSKGSILNYMHQLVSHNVIGDLQYRSRYRGFNGELHFSKWVRNNKRNLTAPGGLFVPLVDTDNSFQESIYILTAPNNLEDCFMEQLSISSDLSIRGAYYVTYDPEEPVEQWTGLEVPKGRERVLIPIPSSLQISRFHRDRNVLEVIDFEQFSAQTGLVPYFRRQAQIPEEKRLFHHNKLMQYDYSDIVELYIGRFVLDCLCSLSGPGIQRQRGAPLDIDFFIKDNNGDWDILEVKEKDLSRNGCFGMDLRRIDSLFRLKEVFETNAFYIVRHIDNQDDRNFLDWKIINIDTFNRCAEDRNVQGGFGMGYEHCDYPTRLCKGQYFKSL